MEYSILLLTLASMLCTRCSFADEFELCYLNVNDTNSVLCIKPPSIHQCCGPMADISVVVYREDGCDGPSDCRAQKSCCYRTNPINITDNYKNALEMEFRRNCFNSVNENNVASMMPQNSGLDLVVVSYMCPVKTTKHMPIQSSPTTYNSTVNATMTTSPSTQSTKIGTSSNVAVAVPVSVTIVVVAAVVVVTLFYLRRRRSRKNAKENPQKNPTNNAYIGSVSKSMGHNLNTITSTKVDDQATNYVEIADNSVRNYSFEENNEYRSYNPKERISNNEPPANSSTTDNDPTGEDEYDHVGTHNTRSSRKNNYEHIIHISTDNCHPTLYDKTEFNPGNANSFDDEDNYNHAQQNGATGRIETDDRDGDYSHVGGTVDGPRADDHYTTMDSVLDTQDGSCATNNYFVLEKQY